MDMGWGSLPKSTFFFLRGRRGGQIQKFPKPGSLVLSSDDWMERLELTVNLDIGCSLKPPLLEHIKPHCQVQICQCKGVRYRPPSFYSDFDQFHLTLK